MMSKTTKKVPVELVPCYFCKKEVDKHEAICFGCGEAICDQCDETGVMGQHDVEEHKEDDYNANDD